MNAGTARVFVSAAAVVMVTSDGGARSVADAAHRAGNYPTDLAYFYARAFLNFPFLSHPKRNTWSLKYIASFSFLHNCQLRS